MTADRWSDAIALVAALLGLIVVLAWPRRRSDVARARHPSASAPVSFRIDELGGRSRWLATARVGLPPLALDIVTWRPSGTALPWITEPIVDPVVLEHGASVHLQNEVPDPTIAYDVVVAWTIRHPTGDLMGSRMLSVSPPDEAAPAQPAFESAGASRVAFGVASGALILTALTAAWALADDGRPLSSAEPPVTASTAAGSPAPTDSTISPSSPVISAATTSPSTPATTTPVTTTPATTASGTIADPTTTGSSAVPPATTTSTPSTTTSSTATSNTASPTTPPTDGPRVVISGRVDDCRFGSDCVLAGFTLDGFTGSGEYVCEFDDGSRFVFRYLGNGADEACARSGPAPSITIEVDGIRSVTITRESPDGT